MRMIIDVHEHYQGRYYLIVNGIKLGEYICGKDKKYLNPEKRAKDMIKKRNKVLDINIQRLEQELKLLKEEKITINDLLPTHTEGH